MKKYSMLLLGILTLLLFWGCTSSEDEAKMIPSKYKNISNTYKGEDFQLSMNSSKDFYSPFLDEITFEMKHQGKGIVTFGTPFIVERYKDGEWYKVPFRGDYGFNSIGLTLNFNYNTYNQTVSMREYGLNFEKGVYRFVKDFDIEDSRKKFTLAAVFKVE
ncbi:immunoglobulin-like domain-containing protein [Pontibacillus sp. HMF3514]|uniref:immunoglobulin-like domain-containing protein n=1 Tax=Pontibacillus sp. HMF3514 TaxID=2692425 RepID=UPI00131F7B51|nr:immunoglobulin-like domain-containing protein [Pontibacillus sp. HMF3514]QHE50988.1 hypothetical protein GS400_02560 [Pontibacillus sp. HMF3514]